MPPSSIVITSSHVPNGVLWRSGHPMFFDNPDAVSVDEIAQRQRYFMTTPTYDDDGQPVRRASAPPLLYDACLNGETVDADHVINARQDAVQLKLVLKTQAVA